MLKTHEENVKNFNLTFDELDERAKTIEQLPSGLDMISQAAFLSLRNIQITWKYGYLTHEEAKLERRRVRNRYIKHRELQAFDRSLMQQFIDNKKRAASKVTEILIGLRSGRSVEADALECIGHLLNDKAFWPAAQLWIKEREIHAGCEADCAAGKNDYENGAELQKLVCPKGYKYAAADCASAHKRCSCN